MNACRLVVLSAMGMAAALALAARGALAADLPELVVPEGLGTNIHFTGAPARDLDMLRDGGFRFIRMDFVWSRVERERGRYDFKPYDELTDGLEQRGIRALYILDYSNKLYETDRSVRTPEGRAAFARFAAAAAARYRGRRILWELWNEPNHHAFWLPRPDVEQYMALAREVLPAIRKADPDATIVAPATSGLPLEFLGGCFERGLLDMVDAVTVHPYRQSPPETALTDYLI
ncbi:MAG: cellulase family glycosylhydrolase [Planctomycetota bacterium]|jgi:beta-xylosidase